MSPSSDTLFGYPKYPKFVPDKPRFPQDTFVGRWLHFMDMIDPRTLLVSQKRLDESIKLLQDYKSGHVLPGTTNKDLWEAQKIKQSTVHPDTGHKIFMPFRMSGYVPFGSPIVLGLLLPNPTLASSVFWQWLNQSHNACVNYANRNASKPAPISRFVEGYVGAVTTAVSIAVALTLLIKRADRFKPATKILVQKFVPLPAVCMASTANVLLMRRHEAKTGIEVFDAAGHPVGTSKIAAKKALKETAMTRAFLPTPIFLFPPIIMTMLEKTRLLKRHPRLHLPFNFISCTLAFGLALPVAIAMFPQVSQISTNELEPEIRSATTAPVLFYNKGL